MNEKTSRKNGKKGGRPVYCPTIKFEIPGFQYVILTPKQYDSLLQRYGYELLLNALGVFEAWILSGSQSARKTIGKNNYAYFRKDGWIINTAREDLRKE